MAWNAAKVFRDRNAGLYLGAVLVSGFGDSAMALAAGIWVKTLTGSNSLAALVGFCMWLPTFAGPVLGTVADRVRRRPLLVATNLALAAVMTAPFFVRSQDQVWLLFAVMTLVGTGMCSRTRPRRPWWRPPCRTNCAVTSTAWCSPPWRA
ncbi:hypothetical protein [Streptomyces sp. NPDC051997]|uniref:hypothetical protein n=1 Tax=Streptomyces sp. NPDC051997 TaxID=3155611 RepID=UPI003432EC0D